MNPDRRNGSLRQDVSKKQAAEERSYNSRNFKSCETMTGSRAELSLVHAC